MMKKRFWHIGLISVIAILAVFLGINIIDSFKEIKVEDLVGNRSEIGNVEILAERKIGVFSEKRYVIGDEDTQSKMTLEVDDHNGFDIYKNSDLFKYRWAGNENVYRDKETIAFVTDNGYKVEIRVKDLKTGEIKSKELSKKELNAKNQFFYTMAVYYENGKVRALVNTDTGIEIIEYDFNNDKFQIINTYGDIYKLNDVDTSNIIERDGERIYALAHKIPNLNKKGTNISVSNVKLFEINLKEGILKTYDLDKFFKENNLSGDGRYYSLSKVSNGIFYSDFIKSEVEGKAEASFLGLDLSTGETIEYKNILNEEELSKYGLSIWGISETQLCEGKLYFIGGNDFRENSFYVGCINLNDGKLIYLGKIIGARFNKFQDNN